MYEPAPRVLAVGEDYFVRDDFYGVVGLFHQDTHCL